MIAMGNSQCALCGVEFVLSGCLVVNGAEHHVSGELDKGKVEGGGICPAWGHYLLFLLWFSTEACFYLSQRECQPVQKCFLNYYATDVPQSTLLCEDAGRFIYFLPSSA